MSNNKNKSKIMKNIVLIFLIITSCQISAQQNYRLIKQMLVNENLDIGNSQIAPQDIPDSNAPIHYNSSDDHDQSELNKNAYTNINFGN